MIIDSNYKNDYKSLSSLFFVVAIIFMVVVLMKVMIMITKMMMPIMNINNDRKIDY